MKHKEIFVLAGSCLALLCAVMLAWQAVQLWGEREQLLAMQAEQEVLIQKSRSFALTHSNYEVHAARQKQKITQLERQLKAAQNVNGAVQKLQRSARTQGLELQGIELLPKLAAKNKATQAQPVKLSVSGEFFQVLRWLRAVERDGFHISSLSMKQAEKIARNVQLEIAIELHIVNL